MRIIQGKKKKKKTFNNKEVANKQILISELLSMVCMHTEAEFLYVSFGIILHPLSLKKKVG